MHRTGWDQVPGHVYRPGRKNKDIDIKQLKSLNKNMHFKA